MAGKIIDLKRLGILFSCFKILSKESSFNDLFKNLNFDDIGGSLSDIFINSSTGHKFVIHSIVSIIAHADKRSLVLFDEPETHLHPPLLAVLMSSIRYVLEELDAFCIVATHSPVVAQETLSRHVNIIRRSGDVTKIISPEIQTFGENLASITSHVFSLSSEITDFHNELDKVVKEYKKASKTPTDEELLDKAEGLFDGEMSMQATAYVMALLANRET